MMLPNIETFIGCESSFEEASIVLYGAPFDSTTSFRPVPIFREMPADWMTEEYIFIMKMR